MNGAHTPNVNITQNGEVSYSAIPTMPSSTHSSNQMSLSQGIGQMSMTDVNLEQALDRIQELHRENNELRDYLKDNNEKMKLQYQNLSEWKEKIRVNNARNKEKFDQTKEVVQTMTRENAELKAQVSAKATELQQLQRSVVEMDSDLRSKQEALTELRKTVEEMRQSTGGQAGGRSPDFLDAVLVNHDSGETAAIKKENVLLKTQISELENKVKQFRENNDSLMRDLDSYKTVKQELQENNAKLERENTELGQRIEGLLNENKGMKSETRMLRNRVEEVEQQMSRVQASAVSTEEDRKTQAEVWKSDFDAERDSRERLHAEKSQLENELKQLQLRNQQLLDEMENFSKRQFQEMQQRHANQGFQHSLQQHLRVGQQNHGSPYQPPTYTTQSYPGPAAGAGAVYDNRSTNMTMGQSHGGSQEGEELQQFECPKCNQTCPDMDTLQIHVLDCIDQDMT
uniref:CCHC NOA-type domain-containing protein n=1 Tax=Magallana gigas TaxID=29159 RepID=A0A8W8M5U9_MAGGI